ncbi:leucine rich repeat containing protein 7 lap1 [Brevipalpus obovatus]|uniref:leucine rich repeat containing protein 7 lap1 n=1 Tax=Brevipalpus obovatus TaxID=246614 RepID=UPI003D9E4EF7
MNLWKSCYCLGPCFKSCTTIFTSSSDHELETKVLDFSHSNLSELPNDVFILERSLEELILDSNSIRDLPRTLFHCTGLRKLSLSDNEIETIPSAISSLVYLKHLDISRNSLLSIPENIKCLKCLTFLDCSVNPLKKLPDALTQLVNLQYIYLNDTLLDYLPANFGRLCRLKIVELRENNLMTLPKSISRLVQSERFDIGQNSFIEFPEVLSSLTNLSELWCDANRISIVPKEIGYLKKLTYFDASNNCINEISQLLGNCTALTDLILSLNKISKLPDTLCNLKNLTYLRLDENDLSSLPQNIGELSALQELVINNNLIETLPETIGLLRNLHTFIADCNQIKALPSTICSCTRLRILSLSSNELSYLPDDIGHLSNLKVLNLRCNQLRYLPLSFAKIVGLRTLWLSENQQKPIMRLQTDFDEATRKKVLTCFLLPQQPSYSNDGTYLSDQEESGSRGDRSSTQSNRIKFCTSESKKGDEHDERLSAKLVRNPTPYPKELKKNARHVRNIALRKRDSLTSGEEGSASEMVEANITPGQCQEQSSQVSTIKEAKMKALKDDLTTIPGGTSLFNQSPYASQSSTASKERIDTSNINPAFQPDKPQQFNEVHSSSPAVIHQKSSNSENFIHNQHLSSPLRHLSTICPSTDDDRGYRSDQEIHQTVLEQKERHPSGYSSDYDFSMTPMTRGLRRTSLQYHETHPSYSTNRPTDPQSHTSENFGIGFEAPIIRSVHRTSSSPLQSEGLPTVHSMAISHTGTQKQINSQGTSSSPCPIMYNVPANYYGTWRRGGSATSFPSRPSYQSAPSQVIFQQLTMGRQHPSHDGSAYYGSNFENKGNSLPRGFSSLVSPRHTVNRTFDENIPPFDKSYMRDQNQAMFSNPSHHQSQTSKTDS